MLGGIFTSMRLYFRKLRGIQDRIEYFFYFQDVDLYWVFTSLTIGVIWISGIATYLATWKPTVMMLMFFLPIIIALYLNFYLYWVKNDYSLVLDISAFNLKNKKKIEQETELIKRITIYQEGMLKVMSSQDTAKHSMAQMVGMTLTNKQLQEMKIEEQKGPEIAEERESIEVLRAKSGLAKIDHLMENVPKDLKDWKTEMNVFKAFFKGNLCKSDYAAIISLILMLAFLGLNAGIIYAVDGSLMFGTSISVLVFVFTLIVLPINEYLATSRAFGVFDYVSIIVGLVINYGFGYVYYHTELNSNFATDAEAINICFLSFFFPIVIFYLIGFWK